MSAIAGFVFAFQRPDEQWSVINDAYRRLVVTLRPSLARQFADELTERVGMPIVPVQRNPIQIAELVMSAHVAATEIRDHVLIVEQGTEDEADARFRVSEVVNAVPLDTVGDWWASQQPHGATA